MAKTKTSSRKNYAEPGKAMSSTEFAGFLKEAESGSFISVEESKKKFSEWRKKHYKL